MHQRGVILASVFIASSTEGKSYAEMAMAILSAEQVQPRPWWSGRSFPVGQNVLESLLNLAGLVDAALIIATPDDETSSRGQVSFTAAQNLLLEYGLFAGRLGAGNVAVLEVDSPTLPSDLGGVVTIKARSIAPREDPIVYQDVELKPKIRAWLEGLDAGSSDSARISKLVEQIAPRSNEYQRIKLKASILRARLDPKSLSKLPASNLEHLLLKYAVTPSTSIGYQHRIEVEKYIDLAQVPADSEDERALANHLARYVADLGFANRIQPTIIAISKTASGLLTAAARLLPFPTVLVNPNGPNKETPLEGGFQPGDRAILLHDVALSGYHLVDCISILRAAGLECDDLVALTRHQAGCRELETLTRVNGINVFTASAFAPNEGRVISGDFVLANSAELTIECVICDVLAGKKEIPSRRFIGPHEMPSDVLYETRAFSVVSDVSPLAPGHCLITSKNHVQSLSNLSSEDLVELDRVHGEVARRLGRIYGKPTVAFEHGLCNRARVASCGIDHAHLHVIPFIGSLSGQFARDYSVGSLSGLPDIGEAVRAEDEYLLLIDTNGEVSMAFPENQTRQYFRRIISELTGREFWNWDDDLILAATEEKKNWILDLHRKWPTES
jgi:diadenosine tetraphosphate (Ap4A) HIT family hydrolase/orotate phosphoribosyltransferase